jgi:uncharacterized protein (DUF2141 family)
MRAIGKISHIVYLMLLISLESYGQESKQTVRISNLKNIKGNLYIGWYREVETFRINEKAIYRQKIVVDDKELNVVFRNILPGKYAIAVFLDENDNYKLDKNIFGIPKEKYGFSNNVLPALRPATFDESAFEVTQKEMVIDIILK